MILYTQRVTSQIDLLTVGDDIQILNKTIDDLKGLCSSQFRLVLGEPIQPLENRLNILLTKQLLDKILCDISCQVVYNTTENTDSLGFPSLTRLVANARVERSSTSILTSISVMATVGVIFV
jgi:hypothetical protein